MKQQMDDSYPALRLDLELAQIGAQVVRAVAANHSALAASATVIGTSGAPTTVGSVTLTVKATGKFRIQSQVFAINAGAAAHNITYGYNYAVGTGAATGTATGNSIAVASGTTAAAAVGGQNVETTALASVGQSLSLIHI